jgi:hypothetical protein
LLQSVLHSPSLYPASAKAARILAARLKRAHIAPWLFWTANRCGQVQHRPIYFACLAMVNYVAGKCLQPRIIPYIREFSRRKATFQHTGHVYVEQGFTQAVTE